MQRGSEGPPFSCSPFLKAIIDGAPEGRKIAMEKRLGRGGKSHTFSIFLAVGAYQFFIAAAATHFGLWSFSRASPIPPPIPAFVLMDELTRKAKTFPSFAYNGRFVVGRNALRRRKSPFYPPLPFPFSEEARWTHGK